MDLEESKGQMQETEEQDDMSPSPNVTKLVVEIQQLEAARATAEQREDHRQLSKIQEDLAARKNGLWDIDEVQQAGHNAAERCWRRFHRPLTQEGYSTERVCGDQQSLRDKAFDALSGVLYEHFCLRVARYDVSRKASLKTWLECIFSRRLLDIVRTALKVRTRTKNFDRGDQDCE